MRFSKDLDDCGELKNKEYSFVEVRCDVSLHVKLGSVRSLAHRKSFGDHSTSIARLSKHL